MKLLGTKKTSLKIGIHKSTFNDERQMVVSDMLGRGNSEDFGDDPKDTLVLNSLELQEHSRVQWIELFSCQEPNRYDVHLFASKERVRSELAYKQFDFNKFKQYIADPKLYRREVLGELTKWERVKRWWCRLWK